MRTKHVQADIIVRWWRAMMGEARRRLWKQTYATAKAQVEREKKRVDSAMYVYACAPSMTSHGDVYQVSR